MSFSTKRNEKTIEKINISNEIENKEFNEIKLIKRTLDNNTHEVIADTRLKRITSWRKSHKKFLKNLIYNILTFGILHVISLYHPNLYIKLYCNPSEGKDCDFFLVEDIYGYYTLCLKIHKKGTNNKIIDFETNFSKQSFIPSINNVSNNSEFYLTKNLTYSFTYKSMNYEYNEETNEIIPVYMNLSKLSNKAILNYFSEGLSSENILMKFKERYGTNEYYINARLIFLYFFKVEVPNYIIIIINSIIEIILNDYISFYTKFIIIFVAVFIEYILVKKMTGKLFENKYTIDGEETIKVKRKHLIKDNNFFVEIKNEDLLPGDIIFLKSNDIVPCDSLILEGDCIVNESNSTGSLDIFRKISLKNNNDKFNYKLNNNCILFHGMKIMKTISKLKEGYISVLCVNTGANTFKANQYSNILYLSERIQNYNMSYSFFGGERKSTFIVSICIYFLCILIGTGYVLILHMNVRKIKELLFLILIRVFCKTLLPTYYLTNSLIHLLSVIRLKNENIFCYDKSRLYDSAGKIDTIFFSKTGTLCQNLFNVNGYYPAYIDPKKPNSINYRVYHHNQCKEMNNFVLNYYKDYLESKRIGRYLNLRRTLRKEQNKYSKKSVELMILFLECLLSCNNIDKFNAEMYGNVIETGIFNEMKWDIKVQEYNQYSSSNANNSRDYLKTNANINNITYDNKNIFIDKKISDIYPKNYYKINENLRNGKIGKLSKNNLNNFRELDKNVINNELPENNNSEMIKNIKLSHINNSYKLRIFKKFIINGTLNTSAIVYNFLTKELRFMIKGMAEDILDNCDRNSLPDNFYKTISHYRRNGFIIIICATKLIKIEDYNDSNEYEFYLNNLIFCGFMTLKNKLKDTTRNSLNDLKHFNCKLIMTSGDNEYNCISVGFDSGLIGNKNIYVFDKDNNNRIIIRKIFNVKKDSQKDDSNNNENNENNDTKSNYTKDMISKNNTKISYNKEETSKLSEKKENTTLKHNNSLINQPETKDNKMYVNKSIEKEWKTPKVKNKIYYHKNEKRRRSYLNEVNYLNNPKNNNTPLNSELYSINLNDEKEKLSNIKINNTKQRNQYKRNQDSNSHKKSQNNYFNYGNMGKNACVGEFEKFYYYPGLFKRQEDLRDNCTYCVSGKLLNYLYKNRKNNEYKYLLQMIHKNCKIFFHMSAIDKSISIEFYRKYKNSYICNIGECQSDFDPIMAANVGINLREPKNLNTLLCHYYTKDADIICIKKIIMEGRIVDENISLLRNSSYFCTMIINSYIVTCFIRNTDVIIGQLNILEIILFFLSILAFTGRPDNKYAMNPLKKNIKLYNIHFYTQMTGLFIIKLFAIYFASVNYITNFDLNIEKVDKIFCTYYFILSIELIFSIIFSFNFISFSKKTVAINSIFIIFILLIFLYYVNLISLNSSNFKSDFFKISFFEYTVNLNDSFDDKNRMVLALVCLCDFFSTFFYVIIIYFSFYRIAKYYAEKNENKGN